MRDTATMTPRQAEVVQALRRGLKLRSQEPHGPIILVNEQGYAQRVHLATFNSLLRQDVIKRKYPQKATIASATDWILT